MCSRVRENTSKDNLKQRCILPDHFSKGALISSQFMNSIEKMTPFSKALVRGPLTDR